MPETSNTHVNGTEQLSFKSKAGYTNAALLAAVFVLTIIVYFPGLDGPFLLDDYTNFVDVQNSDRSWETLKSSAIGDGTSTPYRPLSRATLIINNFLSSTGSPFSYKLTNLLIHILTGFLLYLFCSLCLRAASIQNKSIPLLVTALWLLHPLQVSTVLYVVQRMAQLSSLFTLLALIIYLRARLSERKNRSSSTFFTIAGISFFSVLAFASKENAALIPLYILAIEWLLFNFRTHSVRSKKQLWLLQSIFVVIPVIIALIYISGHYEQILNYTSRDFTLSDRLRTQSVAVSFYLGQILFPRLSEMGLFLDDFTVYRAISSAVVFSSILLLSLTSFIFLCRRKYPLIAFGILWYLISHLLESTALPLEMVYEHRNYLALFGPLLSIVAGFVLLADKLNLSSAIIRIIVLSILFIFSLQTFYRALSWSSKEIFAATHLINHPDSERTHNLMAQIAFKKGHKERALSELEQVSRINPEDTSYHVLRVLAWCKEGVTSGQIEQAIKATATIRHRKAARSVLYAIRSLENLYANGRCPAIAQKDLLQLTSAMIENPVIRNEALKYHIHARALAGSQQLREAKEFYLKAWRLKPENLQPALELVQLLRENQRNGESCTVLEELMYSSASKEKTNSDQINLLYSDCPGDDQ